MPLQPKDGGVIAKKLKGPPAKITLDRLVLLVSYVANGLSIASAAAGVGISQGTAFNWQRRGRLELVRMTDENPGTDPLESIPTTDTGWPKEETDTHHWTQVPEGFDPIEWPFVVFAIALEKAQTQFESSALVEIRQAASTSWQAAAWLLERKHPERYGRPESRVRINHEGSKPGSAVEISVVSAADIEAQFSELLSVIPDLDDDVETVDAELVDDERD